MSGTGVDYIEAGGSSYQTAISSGGTRYVESGGTAINPYLRNGGTIVVSSGGLVTSANGVGGVLSAQAGAIVNSAYASGANASIILDNAAILSGTISATQSATVSGGTIGSGVVENISYYASATNQNIASGGVANFTEAPIRLTLPSVVVPLTSTVIRFQVISSRDQTVLLRSPVAL